jgi:hypothetical protein
MDKPQLNYNEYLRYAFSGGIGVCAYLFLNPTLFDSLFKSEGIKDSLFLILISLVIGSFVYAIHRAILYPICLKINFLILSLFGHLKFDKGFLNPFTVSKTEIEMDFRRWFEREKPKSFSKNLLDWFAQIHFLYCSTWVLLTTILLKNEITQNYILNKWSISIVMLISLISHYRSLKYDLKIEEMDKKNNWI